MHVGAGMQAVECRGVARDGMALRCHRSNPDIPTRLTRQLLQCHHHVTHADCGAAHDVVPLLLPLLPLLLDALIEQVQRKPASLQPLAQITTAAGHTACTQLHGGSIKHPAEAQAGAGARARFHALRMHDLNLPFVNMCVPTLSHPVPNEPDLGRVV